MRGGWLAGIPTALQCLRRGPCLACLADPQPPPTATIMSTCRGGGGAGKSTVITPQQLADSCPDWILVAPCGLDLATARGEVDKALAGEPWWCAAQPYCCARRCCCAVCCLLRCLLFAVLCAACCAAAAAAPLLCCGLPASLPALLCSALACAVCHSSMCA